MEEKKVNEQEEPKSQEESATMEDVKTNQDCSEEITSIPEPALTDKSSAVATSTVADAVATKEKVSKKKLGIIIGIITGIVAVIAVVLIIAFTPSKFEKVKKACIKMGYSTVTSGKGYFTVDSMPDDIYSAPDLAAAKLGSLVTAKNTIQYANKELGFSDDVWSRMEVTTASMGRQSEENEEYKVTWTYNPADGLIVQYTKK